MSLLDIGGGIRVIQHELLRAGVSRTTAVDASSAYVEAARDEAARLGFADRATSHHGDFVDMAPQIEPYDIGTLDRVICCYHDMEALVSLSAAQARRLYGLVYPRDAWWVRVGAAGANVFFRLYRNPFRTFVHPKPCTPPSSATACAGGCTGGRRFGKSSFTNAEAPGT